MHKLGASLNYENNELTSWEIFHKIFIFNQRIKNLKVRERKEMKKWTGFIDYQLKNSLIVKMDNLEWSWVHEKAKHGNLSNPP
jgi:hypothetical protein